MTDEEGVALTALGTGGPVEYVVCEFGSPGGPDTLVNTLMDLVEYRAIGILDIVFVRSEPGGLNILEIDDLDDEVRELFAEIDGEYDGLVSESDIGMLADGLPPDATLAVIVWENLAAGRLVTAVERVGGVVRAHERIPPDQVEEFLARTHLEESEQR